MMNTVVLVAVFLLLVATAVALPPKRPRLDHDGSGPSSSGPSSSVGAFESDSEDDLYGGFDESTELIVTRTTFMDRRRAMSITLAAEGDRMSPLDLAMVEVVEEASAPVIQIEGDRSGASSPELWTDESFGGYRNISTSNTITIPGRRPEPPISPSVIPSSPPSTSGHFHSGPASSVTISPVRAHPEETRRARPPQPSVTMTPVPSGVSGPVPSTSRPQTSSGVTQTTPSQKILPQWMGQPPADSEPSTSSRVRHANRCVQCQIEVGRQRLREHRLDQFLQRWSGVQRPELIEVLVDAETTRSELRDILWITNHFLDDTSVLDMIRIAPAVMADIRESLETLLVSVGEDLLKTQGVEEEEDDDEPVPARTVSCRICLERLPTIALISCGHILCIYCLRRIFKCPFCRKAIAGRMNLFM